MKYRTAAVVGLSRDAGKYSYQVAEYLKSKGYRIIPINPFADEILGEKAYRFLNDIPDILKESVEIVDIFRRPEDVLPIVDEAITLRRRFGKSHVIWMQLGIINEEAADKASKESFIVVMNRCMMAEHRSRKGKPGFI